MIAELTDLGAVSPGPPGASDYDGARARVITRLAGRTASPLAFGFRVQTMSGNPNESPPRVGRSYILLLAPSRRGGEPQAVRFLELTDANRAAVRRAIAARHRPRR